MEKKKVYWIRFHYPGFMSDSSDMEPVNECPDPQNVVFPNHTFSFSIWERTDIIDDDIYKGPEKKIGKTYYHPDSVVETLAQVIRNPSATSILVQNMKCNGWDKIIWTRSGAAYPFNEEEACILSRSE